MCTSSRARIGGVAAVISWPPSWAPIVTWTTWPVTVRATRLLCGYCRDRYQAVINPGQTGGGCLSVRESVRQQDPGIADVLRVEALLHRPQHLDPERPDLPLQPGPVVGAHGVVVRERAARGDQGVG